MKKMMMPMMMKKSMMMDDKPMMDEEKSIDWMKFPMEDIDALKSGAMKFMMMHMMRENKMANGNDKAMEMQNAPDATHTEFTKHPMDSMFEGKQSMMDEMMEAEPPSIMEQEDEAMDDEMALNNIGRKKKEYTFFTMKEPSSKMMRMGNMGKMNDMGMKADKMMQKMMKNKGR